MSEGSSIGGDEYASEGTRNSAEIWDIPYSSEPASLILFGSGLLGLVGYAIAKMRRRKRRSPYTIDSPKLSTQYKVGI